MVPSLGYAALHKTAGITHIENGYKNRSPCIIHLSPLLYYPLHRTYGTFAMSLQPSTLIPPLRNQKKLRESLAPCSSFLSAFFRASSSISTPPTLFHSQLMISTQKYSRPLFLITFTHTLIHWLLVIASIIFFLTEITIIFSLVLLSLLNQNS